LTHVTNFNIICKEITDTDQIKLILKNS